MESLLTLAVNLHSNYSLDKAKFASIISVYQ